MRRKNQPQVTSNNRESFRCGYIAIAGAPNVGKSTLLNSLMGMKLSIITSKPQTTRRNILGILTSDDYQAILVDTPGLIDPAYRLQSSMRAQAVSAIRGADVLLLMEDAVSAVERGPGRQTVKAIETVGRATPVVLVLNKIDRVHKDDLLPVMDQFNSRWQPAAIVPISALNGDGVDVLLNETIRILPEGPPLYPEDMITEHPERFFVSEFVREAVFNRFGKEIPYATATAVEEFRRGNGKTYISVNIYVERESQRPILLGKGGKAIKEVGRMARKSIEEFLGEPVYLDLWVKVKENWRSRDAQLKDLDLI